MSIDPEKLIPLANDAPDKASLDRAWSRIAAGGKKAEPPVRGFWSHALAAGVMLIVGVGLFALVARTPDLNDAKVATAENDPPKVEPPQPPDAQFDIDLKDATALRHTAKATNEASRAANDPGEKQRLSAEAHALFLVAAKKFEECYQKYPKHPLRMRMQILAATTYTECNDNVKALACYDQVINENSDPALTPTAMFWAAECARRMNNLSASKARFQRLIFDYPNSKEAKWARGKTSEEWYAKADEVQKTVAAEGDGLNVAPPAPDDEFARLYKDAQRLRANAAARRKDAAAAKDAGEKQRVTAESNVLFKESAEAYVRAGKSAHSPLQSAGCASMAGSSYSLAGEYESAIEQYAIVLEQKEPPAEANQIADIKAWALWWTSDSYRQMKAQTEASNPDPANANSFENVIAQRHLKKSNEFLRRLVADYPASKQAKYGRGILVNGDVADAPSQIDVGDERPAAAPEDIAAVNKLLAQLKSDEFDTRERAQRDLMARGPAIIPLLDSALKDAEPEVRTRVTKIIAALKVDALRRQDKAWVDAGCRPAMGMLSGLQTVSLRENKAPLPGEAIDNMVDGGLKWLADHQEPDGHWNSRKYGSAAQADVDQTAIALLSFLGAGHTEKVGEFKDNVRRAVAWLKSRQRADGAFVEPGKAVVEGLSHAWAGCAMSEAAGMANLDDTKRSAQLAVDYSTTVHQCANALAKGGFGRSANSPSPDTLTSTVFVFHLKSAKVAGLNVPSAAFDGLIAYFDRVDSAAEKMFRLAPEHKPSVEASIMGTISRQFLGWKKEDLQDYVKAGMKGYEPSVGEPGSNIISNYFGTLGVFQQGGPAWKTWNKKLRASLKQQQCLGGDNRGSWDPSGYWYDSGRVLNTAINTLSMEVYYRYKQLQPGDDD